jgi:hypothetical protein
VALAVMTALLRLKPNGAAGIVLTKLKFGVTASVLLKKNFNLLFLFKKEKEANLSRT